MSFKIWDIKIPIPIVRVSYIKSSFFPTIFITFAGETFFSETSANIQNVLELLYSKFAILAYILYKKLSLKLDMKI